MAPSTRPRKRKEHTEAPRREQPRKRQKALFPRGSSEEYFLAKSILEETATKYLIDWEGTDPTTGEPYAPTWEPKKNALPALVADWKKLKASAKPHPPPTSPQATARSLVEAPEQLRQAQQPEIPSSPLEQPARSESQGRFTNFTHSQPTPSQTPEQDRLDLARQPQGSDTELGGADSAELTNKATVAIVPSQREIDSDLYKAFSSQPQASSSPLATLPTTPEGRRERGGRRTNFVIPDTQEPDSSSFLPETGTASGVNTATQEDKDSSSIDTARTSSPIEEITQYHQHAGSEPGLESDPITDFTSPQRQEQVLPSPHNELSSPFHSSTQRTDRVSPQKSITEAPQALLRVNPGPVHPPDSLRLQEDSLHQSIGAGCGPNTLAAQVGGHHSDGDHTKSISNSHAPISLSSSTSERDWATVNRVTATAEIFQSIERSPTPSALVRPDPQEASLSHNSPNQADILTEGEYSGPGDNSGVNTNQFSIQGHQSGSQSIRDSPFHRLLLRSVTPKNRHRTSLSQPSSSTRFATQLPRTPLRTMDATSAGSTHDTGARSATRSLAEKLADVSRSGAQRGRSLKDIATSVEAAARSPSVIPNQLPLPNPPNSGRSRMQVEDFGPELGPVPLATAVPELDAMVEPTVVEPTTTDRSTPLSDVPNDMDNVNDEDKMADTPTFPNLGLHEYALALPSPGSSTDAYRKHLTAHAKLITDFCAQQAWPEDAEIVLQAKKLIRELKNYVIHPDLENDDALTQQTPPNESLAALSEWDMSISAKFNFLGSLLVFLENSAIHIVVTSANAIIIDKLRRFLAGRRVSVDKPSSQLYEDEELENFVSVMHTADMAIESSRPADLIITFDNSLDIANPNVVALRKDPVTHRGLVPVLHLFVDYSIEHVEFCLPRSLTGVERLQRLLHTATEFRRSAGKLESYETKPQEAMTALAVFYITRKYDSSANPPWPLPLPDIIDSEPMSQSSSGVSTSAQDESDYVATGQKRPLADDTSEESNKRARVDNQSVVANQDASLTRISDSLAVLSSEIAVAAGSSAKNNLNGAILAAQVSADSHERIARLSDQVVGLTAALEGLQGRFEEQTKELRATRKEHEAAKVQAGIFQKQVDARDATITALKDERIDLRKKIQAQSEALEASEVPEIAELEKMRIKLAAMEKERDKADARYKSGESTNDYMRTQYQQASGRAMELTAEMDTLKARNAELETKASGEAAKLKQLQIADRERAWQDEVEQLKGRIESLEILVTRLQEQKRELQNQGRVQTRQGSMPPVARSPRVGAGSRTGSPAPAGFTFGGSRLREGVSRRFED